MKLAINGINKPNLSKTGVAGLIVSGASAIAQVISAIIGFHTAKKELETAKINKMKDEELDDLAERVVIKLADHLE